MKRCRYRVQPDTTGWYLVLDTDRATRTATGIEYEIRASYCNRRVAYRAAYNLNKANETSETFAAAFHASRFERAKGAA